MKHLKNLLFLSASIVLIGIACSKSSNNPQTSGNWVARFEMSGWPRSGAAAFVIGDTGYIATGFNKSNDSSLSDLWQMSFDPQNSTNIFWTQKAFFPGHARHSGVGFAIGSKGYVATGVDDLFTKYQDCYEYNPATNSWTQKAPLPDNGNGTGSGARYNAVAFTIGNYGYVGTGNNGSWLNDFWKFDPSSNSWSSIGTVGYKREGAVVFTDPLDTAAYLVTGGNNGSVSTVNDFWRYSPANGWQRLRNVTNTSTDNYDDDYTDIVREYAVAFVMPNNGVWKAYLTNGTNGSPIGKTWEYDFKTDLWTRKTPYEHTPGRINAVAWSFINLKRGFVGTGQSGNTSLDDIDEWFPAETYESTD